MAEKGHQQTSRLYDDFRIKSVLAMTDMGIGKLAELSGVKVPTIRFYEERRRKSVRRPAALRA